MQAVVGFRRDNRHCMAENGNNEDRVVANPLSRVVPRDCHMVSSSSCLGLELDLNLVCSSAGIDCVLLMFHALVCVRHWENGLAVCHLCLVVQGVYLSPLQATVMPDDDHESLYRAVYPPLHANIWV